MAFMRNEPSLLSDGTADRVAAWLAASYAEGPPVPQAWPGSLRGVQAQFDEGTPGSSSYWDPAILDQAVAADINPTFVRFNFIRQRTDLGGGNYDFTLRSNEHLAKMQQLGIKHSRTLFYGATAWDGDVAGFVAWAVAGALWHVQNYPGMLVIDEIWNEGDGSWPIPAADLVAIAQGMRTAYDQHPELAAVLIAAPASAGGQIAYIQPMIDAGILDVVDVLSFHKYGTPESIIGVLATIRNALIAAGKPTFPIYVSEYGAEGTNYWEIGARLSVMKAEGVWSATYFPLRNYGPFPTQGLLDGNGAVKQQATNFAEWQTRIGDGATLIGRDALVPQIFSYAFSKGGATVRHMWATVDTTVLINGAPTQLTNVPIYVDGDVVLQMSGSDAQIADYFMDFQTVQGQPWEYGTYQLSDSAWIAATYSTTNGRWEVAGIGQFHFLYSTKIHPHPGYLVTARIKFPVAHRIKIVGNWKRGSSSGDSVDAKVWFGSDPATWTLVAAGHCKPATDQPYTVVFDLPADTYINFSLDPLASNSNDGTLLQATLFDSEDPVSELPVLIGDPPAPPGGTGAINLAISTDGRIISVTDAAGTALWTATIA